MYTDPSIPSVSPWWIKTVVNSYIYHIGKMSLEKIASWFQIIKILNILSRCCCLQCLFSVAKVAIPVWTPVIHGMRNLPFYTSTDNQEWKSTRGPPDLYFIALSTSQHASMCANTKHFISQFFTMPKTLFLEYSFTCLYLMCTQCKIILLTPNMITPDIIVL